MRERVRSSDGCKPRGKMTRSSPKLNRNLPSDRISFGSFVFVTSGADVAASLAVPTERQAQQCKKYREGRSHRVRRSSRGGVAICQLELKT